jgi:hypothetical protein
MPDLAKLHQRFREQGLVVVGLTPESDELGHVSRFIEYTPGMDWPNAYGAGYTFDVTGVRATPTYVLFDRTGRSVWASHWLDDVDEAVIAALAK